MIPLKYNTRNLRVRWVTTLLTVVGTGMIVWSSCLLFSLVEGLQHSLTISGDPYDLIVVRKGSSNEATGGFDTKKALDLMNLNGIARDEKGAPLAAPELLSVPIVERLDGTHTNLVFRGVSAASPALRPKFTIVRGRYLVSGRGECMVSQSMSKRFKGAALGGTLRASDKEFYRVVGVFTAGGSAAESEVWVDREDLAQNIGREGTISSVQIRAASMADLEKIKKTIDGDTQFKLEALRESDFFAKQALTTNFLKVAGTLIAVLLTIGAMFAAANTMYAAVSSRTREIGTMRALGFTRFDILVSFLFESVLLCALGGVLGMLAVLPLGAYSFGMANFNTFSESSIHFRFGPLVILVASAMTLAMGVFGGLFPALRAVRMDVIAALRQV